MPQALTFHALGICLALLRLLIFLLLHPHFEASSLSIAILPRIYVEYLQQRIKSLMSKRNRTLYCYRNNKLTACFSFMVLLQNGTGREGGTKCVPTGYHIEENLFHG